MRCSNFPWQLPCNDLTYIYPYMPYSLLLPPQMNSRGSPLPRTPETQWTAQHYMSQMQYSITYGIFLYLTAKPLHTRKDWWIVPSNLHAPDSPAIAALVLKSNRNLRNWPSGKLSCLSIHSKGIWRLLSETSKINLGEKAPQLQRCRRLQSNERWPLLAVDPLVSCDTTLRDLAEIDYSRQILIDSAIRGRTLCGELLPYDWEHLQQSHQAQKSRLRDRNSRHGGSGKRSSQGAGGPKRPAAAIDHLTWHVGRIQHPELQALHRHSWLHAGLLGRLEAIVRYDQNSKG